MRDLNLFKQWVGNDGWKLNRWNARGDVPAITKEDLVTHSTDAGYHESCSPAP